MQRIPSRTMPATKWARLMVAVILSPGAGERRRDRDHHHRCHNKSYSKNQKYALHYLFHLLPLLSHSEFFRPKALLEQMTLSGSRLHHWLPPSL